MCSDERNDVSGEYIITKKLNLTKLLLQIILCADLYC